MAMLGSNSICAVAKKYGVPESTIRSWMSEEAGRSDAFAKARQEAAREIAIRASLGVRAQVTFLQGRAAESQRAAQITERLHRRLDEDTRARDFAVGTLLKDDPEELADATETGLVVYVQQGVPRSRVPIKQYLQKLPKWGRFGVTSVTPFLLLPVHPEGCTPAHRT